MSTPTIYIASKTKHAQKWINLRNKGVNIISTWIDEAAPGSSKDMSDLCRRCIKESVDCTAMIVYAEEGDVLRGAFIEMGVAFGEGMKPIFLVGPVLAEGSAFTFSSQVMYAQTVEEAINKINQIYEHPQPPRPH